MTIVRCTSCGEDVRVPEMATPEARVRCPLCSDEYALESVLAALPPQLILIDLAPSPADSRGENANAEVMPLATGDVPAFEVDVAPEDAVRSSYVAPRPQRRSRNPAVEFLKIALGGLIAIPLAQLILWWFWQHDPIDMAPAVGRYVPWIVPADLRAAVADADPASANETTAGIDPAQWSPVDPGRGSAFQRDDQTAAPRNPEAANSSSFVPAVPPEPNSNDPAPNNTQNTTEVAEDNEPAPAYSIADLQAASAMALESGGQLVASQESSSSETALLQSTFYESMARLAKTFTYVNPNEEGIPAQVDVISAMLGELRQRPVHLVMVGNRGAQWIESADRPTDGVMIFGTVKKLRIVGQLSEVQVAIASRKPKTVSIVTAYDARRICSVGDRVIWLGTMIQRPSDNIPGYYGELPMVILDGYRLVWK